MLSYHYILLIHTGPLKTQSFGALLICITELIPSKGISRPAALDVRAKSRTSHRASTNLITVCWLKQFNWRHLGFVRHGQSGRVTRKVHNQ